MKRKLLLTLIALCCTVVQAWAYDFSAVNSDGKTIYYNKTSTSYPRKVEVTSGNSYYSGSITIPSSVVDQYGISYTVVGIGQSAFWNCSSLKSVSIPNTVTIIKERAFQECTSLESVSIPNTVSSIGNYAFYNCEKLLSVYLPESLININEYAFYGCRSITSVSIPNSVVSVGERAFESCIGLETVIIPNSVNSIGTTTFWGCSNMSSLIVEDGNPIYDSRENCNAIIMTSYNYLCYGCKNTVIPNSVTSIACYSFYNCSNLNSITLPNSVNTIEDYAFYGCTGLTTMTCLAKNLPTTGNACFGAIPSSMDLYVPTSSLYQYQSTSPWNTFNVHGITPEYNITVSAMPSTSGTVTGGGTYTEGATVTVTATSSYFNGWSENGVILSTDATYSFTATKNRKLVAMYRGDSFDFASDNIYGKTICYKITSDVDPYQVGVSSYGYYSGEIVIPNAVTYNGKIYSVISICNYAFNKCKNITSISMPNTITSIGVEAFRKSTNLSTVIMSNSIIEIGDNAFNETPLQSINLPNTLITIGNYVFSGCNWLTAINIPSSVTNIGTGVFSNCTGLTTITLPYTLTSISNSMFSGCTSIQSVDIPDAVTNIGDNAFLNCTNLSVADISWNLNTIGNNAFSGCNNLTSLTIQGSVTSIGENAFSGCYGLESINVTNSNTVYDSRNDCNAIIEKNTNKLVLGCKNTTIPNSITSIGNAAFYGCNQLSNIIIPNSVTSIGSSAFYGCSSLTNIAIPNSVTNIGSSAFRECSQLSNVTLPNSLTSIENNLFYECSNIVNITIPNSVTSIGVSAFQYCGLTSVEIPNSVQTIGSSAFRYCPLSEINIPSGLTSIEYRAFSCCSFTNVNIPNSVTTIGESAFEYCTYLQSVKIPNSVTVVANKAFDHCTSLAEVTCYAITPPPAGKNTFRGALASMIIKVPTSSIEDYQALSPWNTYTINGINEYRTITASSSSSNHGSVAGGGSFLYGATATLTATPNTSYTFINWTENNVVVSTNSTYCFTVTANRDLVANFVEAIYTFTGSGSWNEPSNWTAPDGTTPTSMPDLTNEDVVIDGMAQIQNGTFATVKSLTINSDKVLEINSGASLTVSGEVNTTNVNQLILNDGGQILQSNNNVKATFKKNITNPTVWGQSQTGWNLISTPIQNSTIANFISQDTDYDLYIWDGAENLEWINYKSHFNDSYYGSYFSQYLNCENGYGYGYLVSYKTQNVSVFTGDLRTLGASAFNFDVYGQKVGNWENLNLLGNPFPFDINSSNFTRTNIAAGFATIDPSTNSIVYNSSEGVIKVGQGFFVQATGKNPALSYSNNSKSTREISKFINVTVSGKEGHDNVILDFCGSENEGFAKLTSFNHNIATIFTVNDNKMYGICNYNSDIQEIPLYFKAKEMGNYTIFMKPVGDFNYIHLIDRMTGEDINMLLEDEYKFTALSNDNMNRFIVRLSDPNQDPNPNCFAYQSGGMLYINEFGSIQIVDMTGRVVINEKLSGNSIDISRLENAAYIVRLVNENGVKTQKIVVL